MPEPKRPLKVFLCHAHDDQSKVRELYRSLKKRGIQPWLDEEDLLPGQDWRIEIPKAIKVSDVIVICLSKNSVNKEGYVQAEITFALEKALEVPQGRIFIIPAKFEECEVPYNLQRYHWVDLFDQNGYPRLMKSLKQRASQLERATVQVSKQDENSPYLAEKPNQESHDGVSVNGNVDGNIIIGKENVVQMPTQVEKEKAERKRVAKYNVEIEKQPKEQVVKEQTLSLFHWNLTFLPLVFMALAFISYTQKISDATQGLDVFVIIIPSTIIIISIIQWFLLRRLFSGALRWVGINIIYVMIISFFTFFFLSGPNNRLSVMFIAFFTILSFWLFPNYFIGYLASKQNIIIDNLFSKQGAWNISFWIRWISTPLLGTLSTALIFAFLLNPFNSWLNSGTAPAWLPYWFAFSLEIGIWGGLTGLFQWIVLRDRLMNSNWLIIANIIIYAIHWGDDIFILLPVYVLWFFGILVLAPILAWKLDKTKSQFHSKQS